MATTRLLLATQDRDLLVSLLIFLREEANMRVVGTASDLASLAALAGSTDSDIVLVDEVLLAEGEAYVARFLHQAEPRPRLIVLATDENSVSLPGGADAVALKHASPARLLDSLRMAVD